ncbi:MAG: PAS domain-containing protein [Proteobacteria bacterium]|nr:PAS domain-containing protein [Pseudomonadota bacterium]
MQEPQPIERGGSNWLALAVLLLSLAAVMALNLRLEHNRVQAREQERLLAQSRVVQLVLDEQLTSLFHVLGSLSEDWARQKNSQDFNTRLATLIDAMPGVRMMVILDAQGTIQACNVPGLVGQNFNKRAYFTDVQNSPDQAMLYISPPFVSSLGVFTIPLGRMVSGPQGGFNGVVSAGLEPRYFAPLLGSILYAPDMWAGLAHGSGEIFLSIPEREGITGMSLAQPGSFFWEHVKSGNPASIFVGRAKSTGEERIQAVRSIRPAGLSLNDPLVLLVARDPQAVFADWRSATIWKLGLCLALALFSCLGLYVYERHKRESDRQKALAAQAQEDSVRLVHTVIDNIPGMVAYWDADLRCRFANSAYLEWFGRTREEMLGLGIRELLREDLYQKNEKYILAALGGQAQHFERAMVKADGSTGYTMAHYIPDQVGEDVHGFFVLVSDVTDLKEQQLLLEARVEERTEDLRQTMLDLEKAKTQAESASRMKSDFLANLSHELRTPLNPIVVLTDLVLATELSPQQRDYLVDVRDSAQRLLHLFNRLIELMELETYVLTPSSVALASLREMMVQNIATRASAKGLMLGGDVSPELPEEIWSDLHLLRTVLLELAENAVRFTSQGELDVSFSRQADAGTGDQLCISVRDTGIGIPAERLADINTGLAQADVPLNKRFAGLGIGMAKARKAVDLLGGRLEVESVPDQGSTFRVLLPLASVRRPEA